MKQIALVLVFCGLAVPALAQQSPDQQIQFLSKAFVALQAQRNSAADDAVNANARALMLQDQLKAVQAELDKTKDDLAKATKPATDTKESH